MESIRIKFHVSVLSFSPMCMIFCRALFPMKIAETCMSIWFVLHVFSGPSIAMTCCLSDKHSRCWHYQILRACRPLAFALLWLSDEVSCLATWLRMTERLCVCVRLCKWASMNVHVYVRNRPASGVPYQAGPILTSILSTSSAAYSSAVAGHSEASFCALAEKSQ